MQFIFKMYECQHCSISFFETNVYIKHLKAIHHHMYNNSKFHCFKNCCRVFSNVESLRRHIISKHIVPLNVISLPPQINSYDSPTSC